MDIPRGHMGIVTAREDVVERLSQSLVNLLNTLSDTVVIDDIETLVETLSDADNTTHIRFTLDLFLRKTGDANDHPNR